MEGSERVREREVRDRERKRNRSGVRRSKAQCRRTLVCLNPVNPVSG